VRAGPSGWQYRDWRGDFYPPGVPLRRWLEHYAAHFGIVENNGTCYRLPGRAAFAGWPDRLPDGFEMTVKASRGRWLARDWGTFPHRGRKPLAFGGFCSPMRKASPIGGDARGASARLGWR
jgi:Protein of unknown function DUF72